MKSVSEKGWLNYVGFPSTMKMKRKKKKDNNGGGA